MAGPLGSPRRFDWDAGSVRALRRFLGMSQSAFAAELGIRQQTVSEWETGLYRPRGASSTLLTMLAVGAGFLGGIPVNPGPAVGPNAAA
jgi:DNA-binding transcriptional regulator YiaG